MTRVMIALQQLGLKLACLMVLSNYCENVDLMEVCCQRLWVFDFLIVLCCLLVDWLDF